MISVGKSGRVTGVFSASGSRILCKAFEIVLVKLNLICFSRSGDDTMFSLFDDVIRSKRPSKALRLSVSVTVARILLSTGRLWLIF